MPAATTLGELPEFLALAEEGWHLDLVASFSRLMARTDAGLLRTGDGTVIAFRHRDVKALATTREVGNMPIEVITGDSRRRRAGGRGGDVGEAEGGFFGMLADQAFTHNPPLHEHTRRMLGRQLLLHNVSRFLPVAAAVLGSVVASLEGRAEVDFAGDVARPYVARFWAEVLGLSASEADEVSALMREMNRIFLLERAAADSAAVDRAADRYSELVRRAAERSRQGPPNALVEEMRSDLAAIEVAGRPEDIGHYLAANLFDGFHTIAVAVANAMYCLLASGAEQAVRADPALVPPAVTEAFRLAPPLLLTHRYALGDVVHDGVVIPAGTAIAMLWGSPNRDPSIFPDPDAFRLDRPANVLLTFGGGAHLCPGRNAARLLTEHALASLLGAPPRFRLAGGHDYGFTPASAIRELVDFPIEVRWRR